MPQTLNSTRRLKFTLPIAMSRFIYDSMSVKLFAFIVTSPKISIDLCPFKHIISNELGASSYISGFHNVSTHILGASFIETKDPHVRLDSALGMVSELGLINFYCSTEMT